MKTDNVKHTPGTIPQNVCGDCYGVSNYVQLCPKHAAAPELLDAAKRAAEMIAKGYTSRLANTPYQGLLGELLDAISRAEGGK